MIGSSHFPQPGFSLLRSLIGKFVSHSLQPSLSHLVSLNCQSAPSLLQVCPSSFGSLSSVPDFRKHGRPSLVLFYGVAYSLSALHDSVVPLEEVVCAFVASIADEKPVALPHVLYVSGNAKNSTAK